MRINEIIRERRLLKKLTQEQVANYLGVTTPAVNKWEKGISYPDITLLPALARVLDTDLNTLLSFKDDLTKQEISLFLNEVSEVIEKTDFITGYQLAMSKLKEYPTCDLLLLNIATLLDDALIAHNHNNKLDEYRSEIESLYRRASLSDDLLIREQAISYLISKLIKREDYLGAEELLNSISENNTVDKNQIKANIYIAKGELDSAEKILDEKLFSLNNEVHITLIKLMEIAIKENRIDDATYIADVYKESAKIFDLSEYNSYIAHFQLYVACKKRLQSLKTLIPMLKSLNKKWEINKSPLYRQIKSKPYDKELGTNMQKMIVKSLKEDDETSFLKDCDELKEFY